MSAVYFRSAPEIYQQLAALIDEADRNQPSPHKSFINSGHCEHILPPKPTIGTDGMAYVAVPAFLLGVNGAEQWASFEGVEQIDQETYQNAIVQPGEDNY